MAEADEERTTVGRLPRIHDEWTRLGVLGAMFALSVLFVHVPAGLWAGNVSEFDSPPLAFLALGVVAVLAGALAAALLLFVLPRVMRAALACLLCAAGVVGWGYAYLVVGSMTILDGQGAPMEFHTALGAWELLVIAVACLAVAAVVSRAAAAATLAFAVLNVTLAASTAVTVVSARETRLAPAPSDTVFRFSPRENVLVVLLDGLQSDVADDVLQKEPALSAAFDGFLFYRNTVSAAPTTFLSLPAIHSGEVFQAPANLPDYFTQSIVNHSFMNRFADAGYDTTLVNPIEGICPARVATCTTAARLLRSPVELVRRESLQLLDLALFRVSPVWVKERIYDGGNWFLSAQLAVSHEVGRIFEGNRLFEQMALRFARDSDKPTMKFLHSYATHTPYVLSDDCGTAVTTSLERMAPQAHCALAALATLLDRLKKDDAYDSTVILVLADHGINPGVYGESARNETTTAWMHLAGAANPVFLLKPRGSRGALRGEPAAVHLADVGATLCALTRACTAPVPGVPAGEARPDRPRRFNNYVWKHEFWDVRRVPAMTSYDIRGPVWNKGAWRHPGRALTYHLGDEIRFDASGTGHEYLQLGWNGSDPFGCWTSDRLANIVLRIADPVDRALELTARVKAFVPPSLGRQSVTWLANGMVLDTWTFRHDAEPSERRLIVPHAALAGGAELVLQLEVSAPTSPLEAGTGRDPRPRGVALAAMTLVASASK